MEATTEYAVSPPTASANSAKDDCLTAARMVLMEVSTSMQALLELLNLAQNLPADPSREGRQNALLVASEALAARVGGLADRTARGCGAFTVFDSTDEWVHPPVIRKVLSMIEPGVARLPSEI